MIRPSSSNAFLQFAGPLTEVWGVVGGKVLLPCDMNPPLQNDSTHLVLFYHGALGTPIYSLDSRGKSLEQASHWAEQDLGHRAVMRVNRKQHGLLLENIELKDQGMYRCRVDFVESPTRNVRVRLRVVVPPRSMTITNDLDPGRKVTAVAGPFALGAVVNISCQVLGGHPRPKVTWWERGSLLDNVSELNTSHVIRNTLSLPPLTRRDLHRNVTCQARNSNLVPPMTSTISLDMHFPPTSIRLVGRSDVVRMKEGVTYQLVCEVEGSRPAAVISWWKDGEELHDDMARIEVVDPYTTRSALTLTPVAADDGSSLTCRGYNPNLSKVLENATKLSVLYKPHMELQVGLNIDLKDIEEGDTVHFDCIVDANPAVTGVQWAHNGVPLKTNLTRGIQVSPSKLILQEVTRAASGYYTCAAANTEGARTSNALQMDVKFPPTCVGQQQLTYGAARHETLEVPCQVKAHPNPLFFRWAVNSSTGLVDVPLNLSTPQGPLTSVVRYTPQTNLDFGELLCWASNEIGQQREPCVFSVIPAAKPEPVSECVAENNGTMPSTYAVLSCLPGWNGGLAQSFALEVRQAAKEEVLEKFRQAPEPVFIITGLKEGVHYLLTVTAANSRGSSSPVTLNYTTPAAATRDKFFSSDGEGAILPLTPYMLLLVVVLVGVVALVGVGVMLVKKARHRRDGADIMYKSGGDAALTNHADGPTIVCVDRDCEKEELMKTPAILTSPVVDILPNHVTHLNNVS
ncbi:synaptogenesis protein syg-2-like [Penaeus japonicus]|uniref:synaptogenesis protein syg-2-like n=1 Tax=Penaeus japonicus TaxID=27405 RepID=UPI001C7107B4|nr:synaptogenesis protein syg-2-like [Penaeus japonicus]